MITQLCLVKPSPAPSLVPGTRPHTTYGSYPISLASAANAQATILMVTHDAFSASYCDRIFFLKDGEIKTYLDRGEKDKQGFFADILDAMAKIAEDSNYVS